MKIPEEFTKKLAILGYKPEIINISYEIYKILCEKKKEVLLSKNAIKRMAGIGSGDNKSLDKSIMAMLKAEIINDNWEVIWKN
jgi:hypothetical protein